VVRELCVGAMAIKAELEGSSAAGPSRTVAPAASSSSLDGETREDGAAGSSSTGGKRRLDSPEESRAGAKRRRSNSPDEACTLFTMPPVKESSLMPAHIQEAFARLQRKAPALGTGWGGRPGGLRRTRVRVI
jgi:transcription initiation protein SPT3